MSKKEDKKHPNWVAPHISLDDLVRVNDRLDIGKVITMKEDKVLVSFSYNDLSTPVGIYKDSKFYPSYQVRQAR